MSQRAGSNAIAGVCGEDIYVIGGLNTGTGNLTANERYDPVADGWAAGPPLPSSRSELASTAVSTGLEIYAIGRGAFGVAGAPHDRFQCAAEPKPMQTPCPTGEKKNPSGCKAVGGISADGDLRALPLETDGSTGTDAGVLAGVIAGSSALALTLIGAAWYTRRRWLR